MKGLINCIGTPIAVSIPTCTMVCRVSNSIGESRLFRAALVTRVLAIAHNEWKQIVKATSHRDVSQAGLCVFSAIMIGYRKRNVLWGRGYKESEMSRFGTWRCFMKWKRMVEL